MANTIKVLFWLHRSKTNAQGKTPLILRLTYLSQRQDKATGFYVQSEKWNPDRQQLKGGGIEEQKINTFILKLTAKAFIVFQEAVEQNDIDLRNIMGTLFAKPKVDRTLIQTIKDFNADLKQRVGNDYTISTYEKYLFTFDKVQAFLLYRKLKDIRLKDLNASFIVEFDHYLRTVENNKHNTAVKYCLNLKRIINVAVLKGWIPNNPLTVYKTVYKDTQQVYLDENELSLIRNAVLTKSKYQLAVDLFLFQANTGLAYTDLSALQNSDISATNGQQWIIKARQKTEIVATIPILTEASALINKYKDHKKRGDHLFPTISIQKYNQYLAEIRNMVGLSKRLSSHVGRRTFGNIALSRGISLNVISKILGHSNTIITQRIYAITTQKIIGLEIEKWKQNMTGP